MRALHATLALTLLLLAVQTVAARPAVAAYPAERPGDARVQLEVQLAVEFWAARGVVGCPQGIIAVTAPSLRDSADATEVAGRGGGCRVWLTMPEQGRAWASMIRSGARVWAAHECAVVVHEVGHALGLGHAATGVMAADTLSTPWVCHRAALGWYPRRHTPDSHRVFLGRTIKRPLLSHVRY